MATTPAPAPVSPDEKQGSSMQRKDSLGSEGTAQFSRTDSTGSNSRDEKRAPSGDATPAAVAPAVAPASSTNAASPAAPDGKQPHWLQAGEHHIPDNKLAIVMPGLMLSVFLAALDQTILAVALPTIAQDLSASPAEYSLVASLYLITAAAMTPVYGRLSDLTGRKPILYFAIIVFIFGSALCGAAKNITWLLAARAVQGIGGGGIISMAQVTLSDIVPLETRASWAGLFGLTWSFASAIGPLAGGALTDKASWRWCFYINLPTGGVAFGILLLFLKLNPRPKKTVRELLQSFDFLGLALIIIGVVLLLVGFNHASVYGWKPAATIAPLVVAVVILALFVVVEFHTTRLPIVSPRLFKTRTTILILISVLCHGIAFFSCSFMLPIFYEIVTGATALLAGVRMLPFSLISALMSVASGFALSRIKAYRPVLWFGFAVMLLGYALMAGLLDESASVAVQEVVPGIAGFGLGCLFQTPLVALQAAMPISEMATTTSAMGLTRTLSGTLGITIGNTILNSEFAKRARSIPGLEQLASSGGAQLTLDPRAVLKIQPPELRAQAIDAYAKSLQTIWIVNAPIVAVGLICTLFVRGYSLKRKNIRGGAPVPTAAEKSADADVEAAAAPVDSAQQEIADEEAK